MGGCWDGGCWVRDAVNSPFEEPAQGEACVVRQKPFTVFVFQKNNILLHRIWPHSSMDRMEVS
jgi:hypothetical protein